MSVPARYKGGFFNVPGSTGNLAVTGIGFRPQVVLFFGSNETAEDTVIVGSASAMMRGTMVEDDLTGTIISWCSSAVAHDSERWEQKPIVCALDGGTGTDYQADAVSMDADGFTVNFTVLPPAARKVHYVAIGGMANVWAKIIGSNFGGTSASVNIGWRPRSGLNLGGLDDTIQDACGANRECSVWGHMLTWGGKSFMPATAIGNDLSHNSMYLKAVDTPFTGNSCDRQLHVQSGATAWIGEEGHFTGPFLTPGAVTMTLSGTGDTTVNLNVGPDNQGHFTGLDAESYCAFTTPDGSVSGTADAISSNPEVEEPGLLLLLGLCGLGDCFGGGCTNAMAFGFWTPEHQYSVAVNGVDGSFYQSSQYGFTSRVTASGAHAGEITKKPLPSVGATLTTKVAGETPGLMAWHMFGKPLQETVWLPHMNRYTL